MVKVRDKLEQITLRIMDYANKWDSTYRFWDTLPGAEAVMSAKDIWNIIFGEYPDDLDEDYNVVRLVKGDRLTPMPHYLDGLEDVTWEEAEENWGADEAGTLKGTLTVTLVYGGQSQPPEYLGYDLVDWDNSR